LGVAAVAVGYIGLNQNPSYSVLVGLKETKVITIYSSSGNLTTTSTIVNSNWTAPYTPGKVLTIVEYLYATNQNGVMVLTDASSNTPGFVFEGSSPSFPVLVPYASSISTATEKVELSFLTPSAPHTGDFEYTLYFNLTEP